jgi:hypothetical protein
MVENTMRGEAVLFTTSRIQPKPEGVQAHA